MSTSVDTNDDPHRRWSGLAALLLAAETLFPNRAEVMRWAEALHIEATSWEAAAQGIAQLGPGLVVKAARDALRRACAAGEVDARRPGAGYVPAHEVSQVAQRVSLTQLPRQSTPPDGR
jgi:hypothetical protein